MTANLSQIDSVLKLIDREVWIVTAAAAGQRGGLTATWLSTVSIDRQRPAVLAGIAPNHFTCELIEQSHAFVAHLLRSDQAPLAWNFARDSGRARDKFSGLPFALGSSGAPILQDCLAWLECRVFARYDAGDRRFYWADVVAAAQVSDGLPLREKALVSSLSSEEKQTLIAGLNADVAAQRPRHEAWRSALPKPGPA
ncbi:MAG TPA: flavin reductase family protein [Pirellulaceae bacterium]|nr:flavin reductase family protein [Pirellulaceae bacterium]